MSCRSNSSSDGRRRGSSFERQISRFIGETVTIFTTSGGASGCGFTGVVLSVNGCFVRIVTDMGIAPTNPLSESICRDMDDDERIRSFSLGRGRENRSSCRTGSVCDIPIDRIAAFCHNAV